MLRGQSDPHMTAPETDVPYHLNISNCSASSVQVEVGVSHSSVVDAISVLVCSRIKIKCSVIPASRGCHFVIDIQAGVFHMIDILSCRFLHNFLALLFDIYCLFSSTASLTHTGTG